MKLTINYNLEPMLVIDKLEPIDYTQYKKPDLFIDDKPVPEALADIIMLGINVASKQYLDMLDKLRTEIME